MVTGWPTVTEAGTSVKKTFLLWARAAPMSDALVRRTEKKRIVDCFWSKNVGKL